jgi:phage tail sheath protein FI
MLCVPDIVHPRLHPSADDRLADTLIAQCEQHCKRFVLLSVEQGSRDLASVRMIRDTSFGASYAPWVRVVEFGGATATALIPPIGHLAGMFARSDLEHGIQRSPAGDEVRGLYPAAEGALEYDLSSELASELLRRGINSLRTDDRGRVRAATAVTMSIDERWHSIGNRRLVSHVHDRISSALRYASGEVNDLSLRRRVAHVVRTFLDALFSAGALQGRTSDEAFYVRFPSTTNTPEALASGRLFCEYGLRLIEQPESVTSVIPLQALPPSGTEH